MFLHASAFVLTFADFLTATQPLFLGHSSFVAILTKFAGSTDLMSLKQDVMTINCQCLIIAAQLTHAASLGFV